MHRLAPALLLGGAVLLTSYVNAPAAPTPAPARVSAEGLASIDAMQPLADDVAQETERLRARLAAVPEAPVARRNPFGFGARPRPAASMPAPTPEVAAAPDTTPAFVWPTLVALLTAKDESSALTAVLALGDAVEILGAGGSFGGFTVREITATSVELVHVASSSTTRLAIR